MARQTLKPDRWIVVDDGHVAVDCHQGQEHVRLPTKNIPRESFRTNWLTGLGMVDQEGITLFIEDDDHYRPDYVETMVAWLTCREGWMIVGEGRARFYNVRYRMHLVHHNRTHASLCQTGIRGTAVHAAAIGILTNDRVPERLDGSLWRRSRIAESRKFLRAESIMAVGIKGMPGTDGIGIGHGIENLKNEGYLEDPEGRMLRKWVGEGDADAYLKFYRPPGER